MAAKRDAAKLAAEERERKQPRVVEDEVGDGSDGNGRDDNGSASEDGDAELCRAEEVEELVVDGRRLTELCAVVSAAANDLCEAAEGDRCCSLDELYNELRERDEWFAQYAPDCDYDEGLSKLLDAKAFVVMADGMVHCI